MTTVTRDNVLVIADPSDTMMSLSVGKFLTGRKYTYKLVERLRMNQTVLSTVWKAEILNYSGYQRSAKW
jgi:glycerol-3-phosphate dehydrogenase